jgi:ribonuclease HII
MRVVPDLVHEEQAFIQGARVVAGIDEVGRGAWAGPVTVGVVSIQSTDEPQPEKVRDSKMLARRVRENLIPAIEAWALESATGNATARECDRLGMRAAIALASSRALDSLTVTPDVVIVDGPLDLLDAESLLLEAYVADHRWRATPPRVLPVVKGDQCCATVAAASVLAKVTRDKLMTDLADSYPPFDFQRNVGYPSPVHQCALRGYGLTPLHRKSWSYVDGIPWLLGGLKAEE